MPSMRIINSNGKTQIRKYIIVKCKRSKNSYKRDNQKK
jgi:hypothetical protein